MQDRIGASVSESISIVVRSNDSQLQPTDYQPTSRIYDLYISEYNATDTMQ